MNVSNLSTHQTAHQNLIAIAYGASRLEDCSPLLMSPPTPVQPLADYGFG